MRPTICLLSAALLASCSRPAPEAAVGTIWYDFRFGDARAGWYELTDTGDELRMNAVFAMDGEILENPFAIRYRGDAVVAYRCDDRGWRSAGLAPGRYPTAAFPMLLRGLDGRRTYQAIHEGRGEVLGETELVRDGDVVTERRAGTVVRIFHLDAEGIRRIEWGGGAISERQPDQATAQAGGPPPR